MNHISNFTHVPSSFISFHPQWSPTSLGGFFPFCVEVLLSIVMFLAGQNKQAKLHQALLWQSSTFDFHSCCVPSPDESTRYCCKANINLKANFVVHLLGKAAKHLHSRPAWMEPVAGWELVLFSGNFKDFPTPAHACEHAFTHAQNNPFALSPSWPSVVAIFLLFSIDIDHKPTLGCGLGHS